MKIFSQVTGSSFFLWVMEIYPSLVRLVDLLMQESQARLGGGGGWCEDPGCVCGAGAGQEEEETGINLSS